MRAVWMAAIVGLATLPGIAHAAEPLPLKHGTYILSNTPCDKGSFGNMSAYNGRVLTVGHVDCSIRVLSQTGTVYKLQTKCQDPRAGTPQVMVVELTVLSPTSYQWKGPYGTSSSRLCPRFKLL